jgi:uncharacterized protein (UPF0332 family)
MSGEELLLKRAEESLKAAKLMLQEDIPNIAASRGYYAMLYIAEALLLSRSKAFSSHSAVIAAYGKEFARTKAIDPKFHRYLIAAQDVRQIGDYGITDDVSLSQAGEVIARAEEFLKAAQAYLSAHKTLPE